VVVEGILLKSRALLRVGVLLVVVLLAGPAIGSASGPQVNFQADPRLGEVPLIVRFTNTSSAGEGPLAFHWDFGDGQESTEPSPTHTYQVPGPFGATLTVTDSIGQKDSKSVSITVDGPTLLAALLPVSRSVVVGSPATAFVTVINAGAITATAVSIKLDPHTGPGGGPLPAALTFQTTDAASNLVTGAPNVPVDILAGGSQSFLIALTPTLTAELPPTDVRFDIAGTNSTRNARKVTGLNTLLLSASTQATPDIVALAVTPDANGVLTLAGSPGTGAFSVATVNVGAGGLITASADTGAVRLPVDLSLCRTEPATGLCASALEPKVTVQIDPGSTPTFAVFVNAGGAVPYDPAVNRIFVRFTDAGSVTRGATSVAVKTP
jgi:PKD repeat protein